MKAGMTVKSASFIAEKRNKKNILHNHATPYINMNTQHIYIFKLDDAHTKKKIKKTSKKKEAKRTT